MRRRARSRRRTRTRPSGCDAALDRLAKRFLTTEGDRFLEGRTRTLSMLLSRAPALAEQLRGRPAGRRDGAARSTEPREAYDAVIEGAKR